MKIFTLLFGLISLTKGLWLLIDPDGFLRINRRLTSMLPAPLRTAADRGVDDTLALARKGPGGQNTLAWLTVGVGLVIIAKALKAR